MPGAAACLHLKDGGSKIASANQRSVCARAESKLFSESAGEVRDIAETALQGDIDNSGGFHCHTYRRFTETSSQNELVRGHAGQAFECAQEMVRAETCLLRQKAERDLGTGKGLNRPNCPGHSSDCTRCNIVCINRETPSELYRCCSQVNTELFPRCFQRLASRGSAKTDTRSRDHRRHFTQRRQATQIKVNAWSPCSCVGRKAFEIVRGVPKRNAAVTRAMFVAAFERLAGVAENKRARCQQIFVSTMS